MPSDAYSEAIDRAALLVLAALRDHANPQFSSVQLEVIRLRGALAESGRAFGRTSVKAVMADIRRSAETHLAAELRASRVAGDVGAEMERILSRLLTSIEKAFAER
jgi:hypothetical protein